MNKRHIAALIFACGMISAQAAPAQGKLPESVEAWFQQHKQTLWGGGYFCTGMAGGKNGEKLYQVRI